MEDTWRNATYSNFQAKQYILTDNFSPPAWPNLKEISYLCIRSFIMDWIFMDAKPFVKDKLHSYVFYTAEGYCMSPGQVRNEEIDATIHNFQILGFESGSNIEEAKSKLITENSWIIDEGYSIDEIVSLELAL